MVCSFFDFYQHKKCCAKTSPSLLTLAVSREPIYFGLNKIKQLEAITMISKDNINSLGGMEFATFKLKDGVSEDTLVELSKQVESQFLSLQDDLIMHFLVRGKDGLYAEVAIATTQQKAEEYCQQWLSNPVALNYLELMNERSVNMTFWTRIN
jgi:hypothetical protein